MPNMSSLFAFHVLLFLAISVNFKSAALFLSFDIIVSSNKALGFKTEISFLAVALYCLDKETWQICNFGQQASGLAAKEF